MSEIADQCPKCHTVEGLAWHGTSTTRCSGCGYIGEDDAFFFDEDALIVNWIGRIRSTFGIYAEFSGGCLKFALILYDTFPDVVILYNHDHTIVRQYGHYYDINGELPSDEVTPSDWSDIADYGEVALKESFGRLLNNSHYTILKAYLNSK
jgi:hypothetical protein